MQIRHVPRDCESLAAASPLEGLDHPEHIRQSARDRTHMARRSWSAVQNDDGRSRRSIRADKKHRSPASHRPKRALSPQRAQMPDRPPGRQCLRGRDDRLAVDAVMAIEIRDRAGLAEMLDAQRARAVPGHGAQPAERRRMAIEHGDQPAMRRQALLLGREPA